ncbi:MAG: type II secretion system protein [Roseimicrobium sp.]
MKNTSIIKSFKKGFSLVEMLVVIAVIGVIAAIAIPNIADVDTASRIARDQRNAQNLASVYASARAAGVPTGDLGTDVGSAVDALVTGVAVPNDGSAFANSQFRVPNLEDPDKTSCQEYLKYEGGALVYDKTP